MSHWLGLADARLALALLAIDPGLKGALIGGPPGTGKTALARAARALWPPRTPFVNLPLGVTMDRLLGGIDLERTLAAGQLLAAPGLLAAAHKGVLYVDEINLLKPEIANALQRVLAAGQVQLEREGLSETYPAEFVLVGTFNPAEGPVAEGLRDRTAFSVSATTLRDVSTRAFVAAHAGQPLTLPPDVLNMVHVGRQLLPHIHLPDNVLRELCAAATALEVPSNRADVFTARCARANAALNQRIPITQSDIDLAVRLVALPRATRARQFPTDKPGKDEQQAVESAAAHRRTDREQQTDSSDEFPQDEGRTPHPSELILTDAGTEPAAAAIDLSRLPIEARGGAATGRRAEGTNTRRGRHVRSIPGDPTQGQLALIETLKAAALARLRQRPNPSRANGLVVRKEDMRIKQFRQRTGLLFILAVDASGSMALNRINAAKGAAIALLQNAYVHRDKVALISFRHDRAEVILSPGGGAAKGRRVLQALPAGGRTPLSAALLQALQLARQPASRWGVAGTVLALFTDARANQPLRSVPPDIDRHSWAAAEVERLARQLRPRLAASVVIDTRRAFVPGGSGQKLAEWLGAHYVHLPDPKHDQITQAVQEAAARLRWEARCAILPVR